MIKTDGDIDDKSTVRGATWLDASGVMLVNPCGIRAIVNGVTFQARIRAQYWCVSKTGFIGTMAND